MDTLWTQLPVHSAGEAFLSVTALLVFGMACWRAPWRSWLIGHVDRQHVWLGSLVLLLLLGTLRIDFSHGFLPQFLLVTTLTLMHGPMLTMVGLGVVLAVNGIQHGNWDLWPVHFLCDVAIPSLIIQGLHRLIARRLPRNFWIFIFVTVFAGSLVAFALSALALRMAAGSWMPGSTTGDYLVMIILLGFAEAYLNGLVMSVTVVYRPEWVVSFDDRLYFPRRSRPP